MGERTEHAPGTFSWADLSTTDTDGAKAFYTGLFGWDTEDTPIPEGGVYTMLSKGGYKGYLALEYEADEAAEVAVPRLTKQLNEAVRTQGKA